MSIVTPPALGRPKGFSHGVLAPLGRSLFVAGQIGWDDRERIVSPEFVPQFARALDNVLQVVTAAGGTALDVARLTIYVVDKSQYLADTAALGAAYRERMGRHYPAMTLVEVKALLEPGALVEIEATAVIPERGAA
jgi:enamine deaminase RidA (YjgF/YER057c/UK114 family)